MKRKIIGTETPDNPSGTVVSRAEALRWARRNMPADLKRAGFVASVFDGERGWRVNYSR